MRTVKLLGRAHEYLDGLSDEDAARVRASINSLETGWVLGPTIKSLRGKIREIVVRRYRVVFFEIDSTVYVVRIFRKQSNKTPESVIAHAIDAYNQLKNNT